MKFTVLHYDFKARHVTDACEGRTPRRQEAQNVCWQPAMATSRGASKQMSHSSPAMLAALGALCTGCQTACADVMHCIVT